MIQYIKNVGDNAIVLELWIYDLNGEGVISQAPKLSVRRLSDNQFLDFNDNTFKSSGWTTRQATMTEIDAVLSKGGYGYSWNSSLSVAGESEYAVEYESSTPGYSFDVDYISFMLEDMSNVKKFLFNKRNIDKTAPNPKEVLYDDDETTEIASWELTHTDVLDERNPL